MKKKRDVAFLFIFTAFLLGLPLVGFGLARQKRQTEAWEQYNFAPDRNGVLKGHMLTIVQRGKGLNGKKISQFSELEDAQLLVALVRYNDAATLQSALDQGAQINAREEYGVTALHAAVAFRRADMVKALIHNGAKPSAEAEGLTPLDYLGFPPRSNAHVGTDKEIRQMLSGTASLSH